MIFSLSGVPPPTLLKITTKNDRLWTRTLTALNVVLGILGTCPGRWSYHKMEGVCANIVLVAWTADTVGSGPLIQVFLGWKILTDKCSPLKIFMGGCFWLCYLQNMINVSHGFCRQWVKLRTVQNSRQFDGFWCHIWIVLLRSLKCRLWVRIWAGNTYLWFKPF